MPRSPQWSLSLRFPPPRPYTPSSPHPYVPHAQPISFFSILSLAQYWVRITAEANSIGRREDDITFNGRKNVKVSAYITVRDLCELIGCKLYHLCVSLFMESDLKGCDLVDRK